MAVQLSRQRSLSDIVRSLQLSQQKARTSKLSFADVVRAAQRPVQTPVPETVATQLAEKDAEIYKLQEQLGVMVKKQVGAPQRIQFIRRHHYPTQFFRPTTLQQQWVLKFKDRVPGDSFEDLMLRMPWGIKQDFQRVQLSVRALLMNAPSELNRFLAAAVDAAYDVHTGDMFNYVKSIAHLDVPKLTQFLNACELFLVNLYHMYPSLHDTPLHDDLADLVVRCGLYRLALDMIPIRNALLKHFEPSMLSNFMRWAPAAVLGAELTEAIHHWKPVFETRWEERMNRPMNQLTASYVTAYLTNQLGRLASTLESPGPLRNLFSVTSDALNALDKFVEQVKLEAAS